MMDVDGVTAAGATPASPGFNMTGTGGSHTGGIAAANASTSTSTDVHDGSAHTPDSPPPQQQQHQQQQAPPEYFSAEGMSQLVAEAFVYGIVASVLYFPFKCVLAVSPSQMNDPSLCNARSVSYTHLTLPTIYSV